MRFLNNKPAMAIALLGRLPLIVIIVVFSLGGGKAALAPYSPDAQRKIMEDYTDKLNGRNADIIFYRTEPDGPDKSQCIEQPGSWYGALYELRLPCDHHK